MTEVETMRKYQQVQTTNFHCEKNKAGRRVQELEGKVESSDAVKGREEVERCVSFHCAGRAVPAAESGKQSVRAEGWEASEGSKMSRVLGLEGRA